MYQIEKISKEQITDMIARDAWRGRGYNLGSRQKLLLDFVNSGEKISKVANTSVGAVNTNNLNTAAKRYKINVKAFKFKGAVYLANLTLLDAEK